MKGMMIFSVFMVMITICWLGAVLGEICIDSGPCEPCQKNEKSKEYCLDTGMKMLQKCETSTELEVAEYRSCEIPIDVNDNDELNKVIVFQVIMAIIGGLAFWGVQLRKRANMSLYDYRKARELGRL